MDAYMMSTVFKIQFYFVFNNLYHLIIMDFAYQYILMILTKSHIL